MFFKGGGIYHDVFQVCQRTLEPDRREKNIDSALGRGRAVISPNGMRLNWYSPLWEVKAVFSLGHLY
jgi:hypothetical protein